MVCTSLKKMAPHQARAAMPGRRPEGRFGFQSSSLLMNLATSLSCSSRYPRSHTPQRFAELVDFQDGSVVSRTIAASKAGTLTLFAFDEGQGLSEHSAPYDAYVTVLEGTGELTIDGNLVSTKTGETVLMPGNIPHSVHAGERFKMLLTMLKGK